MDCASPTPLKNHWPGRYTCDELIRPQADLAASIAECQKTEVAAALAEQTFAARKGQCARVQAAGLHSLGQKCRTPDLVVPP